MVGVELDVVSEQVECSMGAGDQWGLSRTDLDFAVVDGKFHSGRSVFLA